MLFPNAQVEAGSFGRIPSLSGSLGKIGFGRQITTASGTLAAAANTPLSGQNLNRIAAIIQNTGANAMVLSFGDATLTNGINIPGNGYAQIDQLFPWCGALVIYSVAGTTYQFTEISNQD